MTTLAEHMVTVLKNTGVKRIFGYPGGATLDVMEEAHKQGVDFVLTRAEWSAAYMAAMTGDLSDAPGVVLATLGPGATNLVNGVSHAYLDRSPMIAITGRPSLRESRSVHQRLPQVSLFEHVTKWSTTLTAESGAFDIRKAVRIAKAERPGPVHLDLPSDQPKKPVNPLPERYDKLAQTVIYGTVEQPDELILRLNESRRPVALVGPGTIRNHASNALRSFVEAWGIPVVTSVKAKGVLDERHPYWCGVIDMAGAKRIRQFLNECDLIVAICFDPVELIGAWTIDVPVIHVDLVPDMDCAYGAEVEVMSNVCGLLEGLAKHPVPGPKWREEDVRRFRVELESDLVAQLPGILPSRVVRAAREVLPEDTLVVTDTGSHKVLLGQLWSAYSPKTYFVSNGLGTMGFGLPGAIAAKLVEPNKPVVCFTGDGGFAMVSSELQTAVEKDCKKITYTGNGIETRLH
ncbi:MAG: thiamine pyrophosphate-binding protein [Firmicutes bacterium]|nr:thiamine pyrophosphate-binding protein [Bacillota bacterium]